MLKIKILFTNFYSLFGEKIGDMFNIYTADRYYFVKKYFFRYNLIYLLVLLCFLAIINNKKIHLF